MTIKVGELSKLSPEERQQFDKLLQQMPELRSKLDTARELNTGTTNPYEKISPPSGQVTTAATVQDDSLDYESTILEQRAAMDAPVKAAHIGQGKVDPGSSFLSPSMKTSEEEKHAEERRLKEEYEERERIARGEAPREKRQSPPAVHTPTFGTAGKVHPVLAKMRSTLGMDNVEKTVDAEVGDSHYVLKRLNREEVIKATSLATLKSRSENEIRGSIEEAIVCFSLKTIDGTEVTDIFDIPKEEFNTILKKNMPLSAVERRERAAYLMLDFLREAPNELTEALITHYEQEFPPYNLLSKEITNAFCPKDNCLYKAVINKGDKRFCPHHGAELFQEDRLPNPF